MKRAMIYATVLAMLASHATAEPEWNGGPPLCFEMSVTEIYESNVTWDSRSASTSLQALTFADSDKAYSPTTEPGANVAATLNRADWTWNGGQGTDTDFYISWSVATYSSHDAPDDENQIGIAVGSGVCPLATSANMTGLTNLANTTEWRTGSGGGRITVPDGSCIMVFIRTETAATVATIFTNGLSFHMRQVSTPEKLCQ